jgi:rhamnopyranosyl-N-acetylglucosaminyl-diphospho-decaprenol beta-1,3/1,4-galactofuranosyltransferase
LSTEGRAETENVDPRIMAVVLTHNAPASLTRCLEAIAGQTSPPAGVLVVDNASRPPVTVEPDPTMPTVRVVRSEINTGPAGGYSQALAEFLGSGFGLAWVLDDDMAPEPDCLERLWAVARAHPAQAFVFPKSRQPDGSLDVWPSWCGFVVSREIILSVGLPMGELFWWAEDTEYLQWRIPEAGYPRRVVDDAIVAHAAIRQGQGVPLWKYYYEARNMLYVHLYVKRRLGRYPRSVSKLLARALLREQDGRIQRLGVMGRGLWDGVRGNLGIRFPVEPMQERPSGGVLSGRRRSV